MRLNIKRSSLIWLIFFGLYACQSNKIKNDVSVQGQIHNLGQTVIVVSYSNANHLRCSDTIRSNNKGSFDFDIHVNENPTPISIHFVEQKKWTTLFGAPGDKINIRGDMHYVDLLSIRGGIVNNDLEIFKNSIHQLYKERLDLLTDFDYSSRTDMSRLIEINLILKQKAKEYILDHPEALASVVLIRDFFYQDYDPITIDLIRLLKGQAASSNMANQILTGANKWNK